jgi:hypothetical protein
LFFT